MFCSCGIDEETQHAQECAIAEAVGLGEEEEEEIPEEVVLNVVSGQNCIHNICSVDEVEGVCSADTCVVFLPQVLELAKLVKVQCPFPKCEQPPILSHSFIGSALYLTWVCLRCITLYCMRYCS